MALILRFGRAAEALVWGIPFLLQPISAVFYPLDVLPPWLQTLAWLLPSTHVFEGMRSALRLGTMQVGALLATCGITLIYLVGGAAIFAWMIRQAREKGYLSRFGMQ
jgi:ABC-2 type transport system permease protein